MQIRRVLALSVALALLSASAAFGQANVQPVVVTSASSTGAAVTSPVGTGSAGSVPMPVSVSGSTSNGTTHIQSSALAANLVVKAAAGNLYDFNVSADSTLSGAAWWVMIYDATSAPGDGTVAPAKCYALPSGATSISAAFPAPTAFTTGMVIGVSTTGCFTKTASTHAFIGAGYQ